MTSRLDLKYDRTKRRPGQTGAIEAMLSKLREKNTCSIIEPCRYGKSDIARLGTLELMESQQIAFGVVVAPSLLLVDQVCKAKKVNAMIRRYGLAVRGNELATDVIRGTASIEGLIERLKRGRLPEFLFSITTQLFGLQCGSRYEGDAEFVGDRFHEFCRQVLRVYGLPIGLFVDECQYISDINTWGLAFQKLVSLSLIKGVPMTATEEREDSRPIPGFLVEEVDEKSFGSRLYRRCPDLPPGKVLREDYEGTKRTFILRADYRYSDRQAVEENPPALCRTELIPVHVRLSWLGESIEGVEFLHEVKDESLAKRLLGKAIRERCVIDELARIAVLKLDTLRKSGVHDAAIIVYCDTDDYSDSDRPPEDSRDEHVRLVEERFVAAAMTAGVAMDIAVVTSNTPDAAGRLDRFEGDLDAGMYPQGTVLIVKNMGGVGFDSARVKVGVDCSSVRAASAWKQRSQRGATPYNYQPGRLLATSALISIYDIFVAENWQRFYVNMGIDAGTQTCTENVSLVSSEIVDELEPADKPDAEITNAEAAAICHAEGATAPVDILVVRRNFAAMNPVIASTLAGLSDSEFFQLIQDMDAAKTTAASDKKVQPTSFATTVPHATATNGGQERERFNAVFNAVVRIIVASQLKKDNRPWSDYSDVSRSVSARIKARAGADPRVSIDKNDNPDPGLNRRCARAALAVAAEERISDGQIITNAENNRKHYSPVPDREFLSLLRS